MIHTKDINCLYDLLREVFTYSNDGVLIWNNSRGNIAKGTIAGNVSKSTGYVMIKLNGSSYLAHRLIWVYHNKTIDNKLVIDHINNSKSDNRIENLRLVTQSENCKDIYRHGGAKCGRR
jgi:hypothetical protein